jgi:hypothetical protein
VPTQRVWINGRQADRLLGPLPGACLIPFLLTRPPNALAGAAQMSDWNSSEWLGYITLWIGAILLALDGGLRLSPELRAKSPKFILGALWAFLPLIFVILSGIFFGANAWNASHGQQYVNQQDHRHLTDGEKRKLGTELAKLRTLTTHLTLSSTNGDPESEAYTHDFADAVRHAGMEPLWGFALPDDPDQIGVIIALKDPKSPPPETEPLRAALQSIGIEPKILGFPSGGFNGAGSPNIVLWIAPRPL